MKTITIKVDDQEVRFNIDMIGKTVFLTQAEAEKALAETEVNNENNND